MRLNLTIVNLIWGITLLLFAVIGEKTANLSLFLRHLDLQKARNSAAESASLAVFSLQITAKTAAAPRSPDGRRRSLWLSVDQPVKLAGVLAGDLVHDFGREAGELLLDVFRGFRPHGVGVRVVGAPHQGLDADVVDELRADRVELERRLALATPVFARLHLDQVAEAVLILEIHAIERIGQPTDAALAERDLEPRMTLQDAGADEGGNDVDEPHLEGRDAGEHRGAANLAGNPLAGPGRGRREGVEVQRQLHLLDGVPQRLPDRMPHRVHVPGAGEFQPLDAHLGDPMDLLHGVVNVAIRKTGETDLAVRIVTAEILEEIIVDAQHLVRGFAVVEARGGAEDTVDDFGVDAVAVHVFDPQMRVAAAAGGAR